MSLTAGFLKNPNKFCARHAVVIDELHAGLVAPTAAKGTRQTLAAANYIRRFSFETSGALGRNQVLLVVQADANAPTCYFLPYKPDAATEMTLGGAADFFFTSTLTGCTVHVSGPPNAPLVVHANAGAEYRNHYEAAKDGEERRIANSKGDEGLDANDKADARILADIFATYHAQSHIDGMLPAAAGAKKLVKGHYVGKYTNSNFKNSMKHFTTRRGYRLSELEASYADTVKPEIAGFVYGMRDSNGDWSLYYQASVSVHGREKKIFSLEAKYQTIHDAIVLSEPDQIYP